MIPLKDGKIKKVGIIGLGILGTELINNGFDFVMYPLVIGLLGPVQGGIILTVLSIGINYALVIGYRKTKQDWFGFEWLELKKVEEAKTLSGKILRMTLRIGHWPAFVFLCWEDAFKAFVFIRGRNKSVESSLTKVDWAWFFGANIIGNLIWILMVSGAIEIIKSLFW